MASRDSLLSNGDESYSQLSDDLTNTDALSPRSAATTSAFSAKLRQHKRWLIAVVAVIVLLILIAGAYAVIRKEEDDAGRPQPDLAYKSHYILPRTVVPSAYALDLTISLSPPLAFSGQVAIEAVAVASTAQIVLHAQLMAIDSVVVRRSSGGAVLNNTWQLQQPGADSSWVDNQFLVVDLTDATLAVNDSFTLAIAFHANLTNSLLGLYYSVYRAPDQTPVFIATTQFEPADARRAFPCFDEPIYKAQFDVSITAQSDHPTTLFNTLPISTESLTINGASWYRTKFARTPRMSTYLLAWVVCDFQRTTTNTSSSVVFSTWASPAQSGATINATYIGARQTEAYERLFNLSFPLQKQDMIAIPDFAAGAMENWGLITYRETAVLYNPLYNSDSDLQGIARVIAHELGHQWFGDIVTMKWWSDIWLNEGFASWVQYVGVSHVFPTWQMEEQFLTDTANQAFTLDALPAPSTHPIINDNVETLAQISALFDAISYNKGACLIKHCVSIVGYDTFIRGISKYLRQYSYSNANSYDLMQVLGAEGGVDLWGLMYTYLTEPNYPLLIVDELFNHTTGMATLTVHQQRFLSLPGSAVDTSVSWNAPINYVIRNVDGGMVRSQSPVWLFANETSVRLPFQFNYGLQDYVKLNVDQSFYYRVQYPWRMYVQYAEKLQRDPTRMSIRDRTNLVSDSFALAYAGLLDWGLVLNLTLFAENEVELTPLTELIGQWDALRQYFSDEDLTYLNAYVGNALAAVYGQYISRAFSPLDHIQNILQSRVLAAATRYNVGDSRKFVETLFTDFIESDGSSRPWADIISTVLNYGIRERASAFDTVFRWYQTELNAAEANRYLAAMASVDDAVRLERLLGYAVDGTIRTQDVATVMALIIGNKRTVFWDWIQAGSNWNNTYTLFESGYSGLGRVLSALVSPIKAQTELDTVTAFFAGKPLGSALPAYNAAVSNAQKNIAFVKGPYLVVRAWMVNFALNVISQPAR